MYIFRVFLTFAHLLYDLIQVTRFFWLNLKHRIIKFYQGNDIIETAKTVSIVNKFKKLPTHFALILGSEEPSISDLIQILTWCLISGIPYVTFYDCDGCLKKQEEYMKKEFLKNKPEFEEYIEWNPEPSKKIIKNGSNGIKHKTRIQCLSYEDGKGKITALAQDLATAAKIGSIKVEEITIELLDSKLNPDRVPEPDLAIICGETFCTYGFLPWHTRITEFHAIPTHYNISAVQFLKVLKNYSSCEQRYGK